MGKRKEANPKGGLYKLIGVGSALLVLLQWAMREPRSVGRVTDTDLHAFFVVVFLVLKRFYDETTIIGDHGDGFVPPVFGAGADR